MASFIAELTGTALQTLAGLGPDPTPYPPRGAAPLTSPSLHDDESASEATFVPARRDRGGASPEAPQPREGRRSLWGGLHAGGVPGGGSARASPQQAPVSVSRRPTDLRDARRGACAAQAFRARRAARVTRTRRRGPPPPRPCHRPRWRPPEARRSAPMAVGGRRWWCAVATGSGGGSRGPLPSLAPGPWLRTRPRPRPLRPRRLRWPRRGPRPRGPGAAASGRDASGRDASLDASGKTEKLSPEARAPAGRGRERAEGEDLATGPSARRSAASSFRRARPLTCCWAAPTANRMISPTRTRSCAT